MISRSLTILVCALVAASYLAFTYGIDLKGALDASRAASGGAGALHGCRGRESGHQHGIGTLSCGAGCGVTLLTASRSWRAEPMVDFVPAVLMAPAMAVAATTLVTKWQAPP